jgi:hypothetical protein
MKYDPKHWTVIRALMLRGLGQMRGMLVGWTCTILGAAIVIFMITADAPRTIRFMIQAVSLVGLFTVGWCGSYSLGWLDRELKELEDDS